MNFKKLLALLLASLICLTLLFAFTACDKSAPADDDDDEKTSDKEDEKDDNKEEDKGDKDPAATPNTTPNTTPGTNTTPNTNTNPNTASIVGKWEMMRMPVFTEPIEGVDADLSSVEVVLLWCFNADKSFSMNLEYLDFDLLEDILSADKISELKEETAAQLSEGTGSYTINGNQLTLEIDGETSDPVTWQIQDNQLTLTGSDGDPMVLTKYVG